MKLDDEGKTSWLGMVREDLRWLQILMPDTTPEEDPRIYPEAWAMYVGSKRGWKAQLKNTSKRAKLFFQLMTNYDT